MSKFFLLKLFENFFNSVFARIVPFSFSFLWLPKKLGFLISDLNLVLPLILLELNSVIFWFDLIIGFVWIFLILLGLVLLIILALIFSLFISNFIFFWSWFNEDILFTALWELCILFLIGLELILFVLLFDLFLSLFPKYFLLDFTLKLGFVLL